MSIIKVDYGSVSGASKPTLLASSDSGITSGGFSYDATPYDYIIVVAGFSGLMGVSIMKTVTTKPASLSYLQSYGHYFTGVNATATGLTWEYNPDNVKLFAVYGVKGSVFDLSDIIGNIS